ELKCRKVRALILVCRKFAAPKINDRFHSNNSAQDVEHLQHLACSERAPHEIAITELGSWPAFAAFGTKIGS
ncbi:MAG: hypothetical protein NXI27_31235, partial [Alphaproteobacteria bacterium]|nr:hypothetical protein [Alphaproteobacteria bacterium]